MAGTTRAATVPCPFCATLNRVDLGTYSIEAYCRMLDWPLDIVTGVRHAECFELRKSWGKDKIAPRPA